MIGSGVGRFTSNPELKKTQNDNSVVSFTLANQKRFSKKEHPESNFVDCVAWGSTAENICKFFSKGSMIYVAGEIETRIYEDKNENKKKITELNVDRFEFVEKKNQNYSKSKDSEDIVEESNSEEEPF